MSQRLRLGLFLFALGLLGVLSLLTMQLPMDQLPAVLRARFTDAQIRWLTLINPTLLLALFVGLGTALHEGAGLAVPTFSAWLRGERAPTWPDQLRWGIGLGLLAGVLMSAVSLAFDAPLHAQFKELGAQVQPSLASRFLYGGIAEELMMRFGLMTLVVRLARTLLRSSRAAAWTGIVLAAVLFGLGHMPAVFAVIPHPGALLWTYVLLGNGLGGLFFGWLYWRKGLEAAMVAHTCVHITFLAADALVHVQP